MKRTAIFLVLLLGILGGCLPLLSFVREVEWLTVDWRYRIRGPIVNPERVVVVAIDNAAERRWAGIPHAMWGTERAKILKGISEMGAKRVGLDLVIAVDTDAYLANRGGETPNTDFASVIAEMGPRIILGTSTGSDWSELFVFASNEQIASVNQGETIGAIVRSVPRRDTFMKPSLPSMAVALAQKPAGDQPLWINYTGQEPISIPALDIIDGKVPAEIFKDKIVLIGETHQFTQDRYDTPFTDRQAGVYIQAEAVETLLNGRELHFMPQWAECTAVALIAMAAGVLAMFAKPVRYAISVGILAFVGIAISVLAFSNGNSVTPLFAPLLMGLLISPAVAFPYRAYEEQGARAVMGQMMSERLFHRFQQGGARDGVLGDLVGGFLFLDIEDFSKKSNEMPPDEFLDGLNRVLSEATIIIQRYGGDVITFVGDGLCAVYEPSAGEDDEATKERAFNSGLELVREVPKAVGGAVAWKVRVGLAWGEATIAVAGSERRKQVSVYGSAVNLASRLEQAGKDLGSRMCVEEAHFAPLAQDFGEAEVTVKGWSAPVAVRYLPNAEFTPDAYPQ